MRHSIFYDWKHHFKLLGRGGVLKPWEEKGDSLSELMTTVFEEQRLALPRSANSMIYFCSLTSEVWSHLCHVEAEFEWVANQEYYHYPHQDGGDCQLSRLNKWVKTQFQFLLNMFWQNPVNSEGAGGHNFFHFVSIKSWCNFFLKESKKITRCAVSQRF